MSAQTNENEFLAKHAKDSKEKPRLLAWCSWRAWRETFLGDSRTRLGDGHGQRGARPAQAPRQRAQHEHRGRAQAAATPWRSAARYERASRIARSEPRHRSRRRGATRFHARAAAGAGAGSLAPARDAEVVAGALVRPVSPERVEGRQAAARRARLPEPVPDFGHGLRTAPAADARRAAKHLAGRVRGHFRRRPPMGRQPEHRVLGGVHRGRHHLQAARVRDPLHAGLQPDRRARAGITAAADRPAWRRYARRPAPRRAGAVRRQALAQRIKPLRLRQRARGHSALLERLPRLPVPGQPARPARVRHTRQQPRAVQPRLDPPARERHQQRAQ